MTPGMLLSFLKAHSWVQTRTFIVPSWRESFMTWTWIQAAYVLSFDNVPPHEQHLFRNLPIKYALRGLRSEFRQIFEGKSCNRNDWPPLMVIRDLSVIWLSSVHRLCFNCVFVLSVFGYPIFYTSPSKEDLLKTTRPPRWFMNLGDDG